MCVCVTGLAVSDLKSKCVLDDFVKGCKAVCRAAQSLLLAENSSINELGK